MVLKKMGLAAAVLLAGTQITYANDLQINGFLNVTAGVLDNKDIEGGFTTGGYDTTLGFDQHTLAGLQISKKVNDNTSATVQLMSRGKQGYKTETAWAYVTYDLSDNTAIRFGRLRTPFFQYSDFLEVGYAYNWITPPTIVYRLDSMSTLTGVDITHQFTMGAIDGSFQLYTGRYKDDFELRGDTYDAELSSAAGAVLNLNAGNFGGRLSYHQAELSFNDLDKTGNRKLDSLLFVADYAAPGTGAEFITDGQSSSFYQGSLFWDNGSTSLITEYTALRHDSHILNDDDAWLVSIAQRFGDVTAHITYASANNKVKDGNIGLGQKFAESEESDIIVGLRYDYSSSVAFKAEAHYITINSALSRQGKLLSQIDPNNPAPSNPTIAKQASELDLDKNTGSLYTIGMSIVF